MPGSIQQGEVTMNTGNENPKVSVIIPCYNGEKFIGEAIESVLNQTYQDFEIIIVDDGSTDNSKTVIEHYLDDKRVSYFQHQENRGIARTRNSGIKRAKGEYIAFLDNDDIWLSSKLEEQLALFSTSEVGLVCCGMLFFDESGAISVFNPGSTFSQERTLKTLFIKPSNSGSVMCFRRACLDSVGWFDVRYTGWDDYELLMRAATKFQIRYTGTPLIKKRIHAVSESVRKKDVLRDEYISSILNKIIEYHPFLKQHRRKKMAQLYMGQAQSAFKRRETGETIRYLIKSITNHPLSLRIYVLLLCVMLGPLGKPVWNTLKSVKSLIKRYSVIPKHL